MYAVMTGGILVLTNITLTAIQYGKTMTMHKNLPHNDGAKYFDPYCVLQEYRTL
jgi:hypothetical protein